MGWTIHRHVDREDHGINLAFILKLIKKIQLLVPKLGRVRCQANMTIRNLLLILQLVNVLALYPKEVDLHARSKLLFEIEVDIVGHYFANQVDLAPIYTNCS